MSWFHILLCRETKINSQFFVIAEALKVPFKTSSRIEMGKQNMAQKMSQKREPAY